MDEGKIPKYLADALIIITADHLGVKADMLDLAKKPFETKLLPEPVFLGHFDTAAVKAHNESSPGNT